MKVIIPAIGSRGDVFPVLSLGRAVKERGDSAAVLTSANFRDEVEEAGLEYIELGDSTLYDAIRDALEADAMGGKKKLSVSDYSALDELFTIVPRKLYRLVEENYIPGS